MSHGRSAGALALAFLLPACGGGGSPSGPAPPPAATHSVFGALFYDENGNRTLDVTEGARIPDAVVEIGARSASTARPLGEFTVDGVPAGSRTLTVRVSSLPPMYQPPATAVTITVPTSGPVLVPVTLPIGRNVPNRYLAFGDSITEGDGSSDRQGYQPILERRLIAHFGRATVIKDGLTATRSDDGADRLGDSLTVRPAYVLIHYGSNDWNEGRCKFSPPCYTIDMLRSMVRQVKAIQAIPVVATIIPANPAISPDRVAWVASQDERIRAMAREEGALLADLEAAFKRQADLSRLYVDHVHPNDAGYQIMAEEFFNAITRQSTGTTASFRSFTFRLPGS
jgi:acyl-CoA thioesterase-1